MFDVREAFPKFEYQLIKVGAGLKIHIAQDQPLCGIGQTLTSRTRTKSPVIPIGVSQAPEQDVCLSCRILAKGYSNL